MTPAAASVWRRSGLWWALVVSGLLVASGLNAATLSGLDGDKLTDKDLASGATIMVVWASWSPKCRDVGPRIDALSRTWSDRARVVSIAFRDEPETAGAFRRRHKITTPVFLDPTGAFGKQHAMTDLPGLLIVRDGKTLYRGSLPRDADAQIERHLR